MTDAAGLWSYLSTEPLWWLCCTILVYLAADGLSIRLGRHPLANPVLIAAATIAILISLARTPYPTYIEGAQFIHFLLGPATVALAIPLHANLPSIRKLAAPLLAALLVGSLVAAISALGLALALGLPEQLAVTLSPKSATAPVAIGISEALGGLPSVTAATVILTGIIGAVMVTPLMNALSIRDWRARGFAAGVAAHGIGTARAFQVNPVAGAFAGIGMALNAILTSIHVPVVVALFL